MAFRRAPNWAQEDRIQTRMNILGASLAKTNRILTGRRDITVSMLTQKETRRHGVPGFSDGKKIVIHRDMFSNIGDAITLVKIMGLNYHELSHILMTPRNTTKFRKAIMSKKLGYAFNALEDQRIETQFVATYQAAAKYFTEMVIEFYVDKQEVWPLAHLLTYGRRFLPLEIREALKDRFVLSGTADEKRAEEIIDEYRLLDLSDVDRNQSLVTRTLSLVQEYNDILIRAQQESKQFLPNPFGADEEGKRGCGSQDVGMTDRQAARQIAEKAKEKTDEQEEVEEDGGDGSGFWDDVEDEESEEEENDDDAAESASNGEEDDEEDTGSGEDSEGGEDDGTDDDDNEDDEDDSSSSARGQGSSADSDNGEEDDGSDGDGASGEPETGQVGGGTEHGNSSNASTDAEIEDIMKDILRGVLDSEQIKGDIRQMQSAINDPDAFDLDERIRPSSSFPAESGWVHASQKVELELRRLYAEVEPGWKYGSDTGRLNVNRAMSSEDYEDVFDEWDEGREHDTGIEAVLVIDTSGSMQGQEITDACTSLWIIKRALDAVDATVSVMSFDTQTKTLFGRHDKVERHMVPYYSADGGNTCPGQSLRNARRILSQSEKPNKVFFIITDGGWSTSNPEHPGGPRQENIEELVQTIPATTVFIGIGPGGKSNAYASLFDIAQVVDHADHVAPLIRTVVTNMLRNAVSGASRR